MEPRRTWRAVHKACAFLENSEFTVSAQDLGENLETARLIRGDAVGAQAKFFFERGQSPGDAPERPMGNTIQNGRSMKNRGCGL